MGCSLPNSPFQAVIQSEIKQITVTFSTCPSLSPISNFCSTVTDVQAMKDSTSVSIHQLIYRNMLKRVCEDTGRNIYGCVWASWEQNNMKWKDGEECFEWLQGRFLTPVDKKLEKLVGRAVSGSVVCFKTWRNLYIGIYNTEGGDLGKEDLADGRDTNLATNVTAT